METNIKKLIKMLKLHVISEFYGVKLDRKYKWIKNYGQSLFEASMNILEIHCQLILPKESYH